MRRLILAATAASVATALGVGLDARAVPTPIVHELTVRIGDGRCYPVDSPLHVRVAGLKPGSVANATTEDTAAQTARADAGGRAVITLITPDDTGTHRGFSARLVEVAGQLPDGTTAGATAAFVLGAHRVCRRLLG